MTLTPEIQYYITLAVIIAVVAIVVARIVRSIRHKSMDGCNCSSHKKSTPHNCSSCSGCSLIDSCNKKH